MEQTDTMQGLTASVRKHLHMRGADWVVGHCQLWMPETSPHAWSRQETGDDVRLKKRNISTCVEQTNTLYVITDDT